jgi:peptide-methionine (S)-S-oxide reductase
MPRQRISTFFTMPTVALAALLWGCDEEDSAKARAPAASTKAVSMDGSTATFGAGCFWGVEARFRQVEGVKRTTVGYLGGTLANPTYRAVCSGRTGHAEVVQVEYDSAIVSYEELLDVFWDCHNPTTLNRQGPDVGAQYRSAIFFHTPEQQAAARASKERLEQSGQFSRPIVTEITPASTFYRAEEYHQQYLAKHGRSSCASTIED